MLLSGNKISTIMTVLTFLLLFKYNQLNNYIDVMHNYIDVMHQLLNNYIDVMTQLSNNYIDMPCINATLK